jgi:hypothetical protein
MLSNTYAVPPQKPRTTIKANILRKPKDESDGLDGAKSNKKGK